MLDEIKVLQEKLVDAEQIYKILCRIQREYGRTPQNETAKRRALGECGAICRKILKLSR